MKTKLFLVTAILTVFSLTTKAQNPTIKLDWAKSSGGVTGNDNAASIAYDASGNVYVAGSFRGTVDFDPSASTFTLASNGAADAFIQKLDANGNFIAAYKIGGTLDDVINGINVDASGNICIAGYFNGSNVDFDVTAGAYVLNSAPQGCFVAKYSSAFALTWAKAITGSSAQYISALNVDANGNVYTAGTISAGTIDFDPNAGVSNFTVTTSAVFLHKLSSTGNLVWAKGFNSTVAGSVANSIDFDNGNNPVFVGSFIGTIDFDASAATNTLSTTGSTADKDAFLCKYDAAGNYLFAFRIGYSATGISNDIFRKVIIDNSNNIYVCGDFSGTTDFDPSAGVTTQTLVGSSSSFVDGFVAKYSNTGGFLWVNTSLGNTANYDYATGLSVNSTGDVFVATTNDIGSATNIAVHKLNNAGTLAYSRLIVTNGYCNDIQNTTTALLVAGNHVNTSEFDPSQYFTNNLISNGASDAFVAKYSECTTQAPSTISGPISLCNGSTNTYSIAPNVQLEGYVWSSNILSGFSTSTANIVSLTSGQTPATGTITLTGYNHCGNTTQTLQVTVTLNTTVNVASSSSSVCAGNSVTLTASGTTSYSWASSGETTASVVKNPTSTTIYTVTGYNGNCSNTKTISVSVSALPIIPVTVNQPTAGCAGSPVTLTASGATSYTWNTLGVFTNSVSVTPTVTTVYSVIGANAAGCVKTTTQTVTIFSPILNVTATSASICPGGFSNLTVSGATTYTWNWPGGTSNSSVITATPAVTTTYVVGGKGPTGCVSSTNIVVYVTSAITPTITASNAVSCSGSPVILTASGASTYTWVNNGLTTNTISVSPTAPTTYTLNGASGSCAGTKTITIGVATSPNVIATTTSPTICAGMSANLVASVSPIVPTMSYTWSTNQTTSNITVAPTITTTYTVIGRNFANGCTNNAVITVTVSTCTGIFESTTEANKVSIYPNPNNGEFTISTTKGLYTIVNTVGAVVKTIEINNDSEVIDIKDLSQGIYYIIGKTAKAKIIIAK